MVNLYPTYIRDYIEKTFKPTEIFHNGNCYSFDYKEVQVDFMTVASEDFDSNYHYLAFNDLGNYIGRIAHRLGLKYGQEGLWYNHYMDGQNVDRIMISKDYREIFKFLDLDYDRWLKGFDDLEDTFEFVLSSKYFDSDMFQLDSLNRINRERNLKRASYMAFLDWINEKHPNVIGAQLLDNPHPALPIDNMAYLYRVVEQTFPSANFMMHISRLEYEKAKANYVYRKFNGRMIMDRYGFKGKEIGDALNKFKRSVEKDGYKFDDYILSENQDVIFEEFEYAVIAQL